MKHILSKRVVVKSLANSVQSVCEWSWKDV